MYVWYVPYTKLKFAQTQKFKFLLFLLHFAHCCVRVYMLEALDD